MVGRPAGAAALAKAILARMGWRLTRLRPANRFDAMGDGLRLLRRAGYEPRLVIDGGANRGQWADLARPIFPAARWALIEPQPVCAPDLLALTRRNPLISFHGVALTAPGASRVRLLGSGLAAAATGGGGESGKAEKPREGEEMADCGGGGGDSESAERGGGGGSTGAYVAIDGESSADQIEVPATTLDELFAGQVSAADRTLLKLDIEGHELAALAGAERLLSVVEVVLAEVQVYEIGDNRRPILAQVVDFLAARGFALYDVLTLSPRPRDQRLRMGDLLFVRHDSPLLADPAWE